jgi:hypothetical protein
MPTKTKNEAYFSYLWQQLHKAIDAAMFASDPQRISGVFSELRHGIHDVETKQQTPGYLDDPHTKKTYDRMKELITPSEKDGQDPRAEELGTGYIRAERMTQDERYELADCMSDLLADLDSYDRD